MITARDAGAAIADRLYQIRAQAKNLVRRAPNASYYRGELAPVLLLPGVYETWQFLRPIADRLNALGHPIHTVRELGYNRLSIVASAELAHA